MTDTSILFEPFTSAKLSLPNRIVMAPMTRNMAPGGVPGQANAEYYRRRAENAVGLKRPSEFTPLLPESTTSMRRSEHRCDSMAVLLSEWL